MRTLEGRLVLATHNPGKVREIAALLAPYRVEPVSAAELDLPEPEETGTTFLANAELKAVQAADLSGLPALADDSGLCVDALGGDPGVVSARWAERGDGTRDWLHAMTRVHEAMAPDAPRDAHFTCALALAWPDGECLTWEGRVDGAITWPPRGDRGFGYDPLFTPNGGAQTFGEMDPDAKHAISHRADAFAKLVADLFPTGPAAA